MAEKFEAIKDWPLVMLNSGTIIKAREAFFGVMPKKGKVLPDAPVLTLENPYQVIVGPEKEKTVELVGPRIYVPLTSVDYWTD